MWFGGQTLKSHRTGSATHLRSGSCFYRIGYLRSKHSLSTGDTALDATVLQIFSQEDCHVIVYQKASVGGMAQHSFQTLCPG